MKRKANELNLEHVALDLSRFSWDSKTKTLSAFESDLRAERFNGTYRFIQPLYNDACDSGCAIRSHHTGNIETFYFEESRGINRDYSGGHDAFYFKPTNPHSNVKEVVIFND
jgi:hypothetical protein